MVEGSKDASLATGSTSLTNRVVIGDKRPQEETLDIMPTKQGKATSDPKQKATSSKSASKTAGKRKTPAVAPREGTSASFGIVLGPRAYMLGRPSVVEKLLGGMIPPLDKENVDKLNLDRAVTKFFHIIGQVSIRLQAQYYFQGDHKNLKNLYF